MEERDTEDNKMQALVFRWPCPYFTYIYAALHLDIITPRVLACRVVLGA